jgi:hypothetical protein
VHELAELGVTPIVMNYYVDKLSSPIALLSSIIIFGFYTVIFAARDAWRVTRKHNEDVAKQSKWALYTIASKKYPGKWKYRSEILFVGAWMSAVTFGAFALVRFGSFFYDRAQQDSKPCREFRHSLAGGYLSAWLSCVGVNLESSFASRRYPLYQERRDFDLRKGVNQRSRT